MVQLIFFFTKTPFQWDLLENLSLKFQCVRIKILGVNNDFILKFPLSMGKSLFMKNHAKLKAYIQNSHIGHLYEHLSEFLYEHSL